MINVRSNEEAILVFSEKHDNVFYHAKNHEDKCKIAYTVLKERYNSGYYYPTKDDLKETFEFDVNSLKKRTNQAVFVLSDEQVESLPEPLKSNFEKDKKDYTLKYDDLKRQYDEDVKFISLVEDLLEKDPHEAIKETFTTSRGKDSNLVIALINARSDHEYEGVREEFVCSTPDFE